MNDTSHADSPSAKRSRNKTILIGVLTICGAVTLCCCSFLAYGAYSGNTPEGQERATVRAQNSQITRAAQTAVAAIAETEEHRPTNTPLPPDTPRPTDTPAPTDTPLPTATPRPTNTPRPTVTPRWYEGGTLHDAKVSEWRTATAENKLATSADWIVVLSPNVQVSRLKDMATELVVCVDETTDGVDVVENMDVTEIAVICALLMGYVEQ